MEAVEKCTPTKTGGEKSSAPPKNTAKWIGGIGGVILAIVMLFAPLPLEPLGKITLALSAWFLVWLIFTPIDSGHTALIFMGVLLILGYESGTDFRMLTMAPGWFQICSFIIAAAMMRSGLARRIAYLIMYRLHANTLKRFMLVSVFVGLLLIFLIPSPVALMAVLMPLMVYVAEAWDLPARSKVKGMPPLALAAILLCILAGLAGYWIKTGFSQNMIALAIAQTDMTWGQWLTLAAPPVWLCAFLMVALMLAIWRPGRSGKIEAPIDVLKVKVDEIGKLTAAEVRVLIVMVIMLIFWITESMHGIAPGWIAIIGVCVLALPQLKIFKNFPDATGSVNWPLLFFETALLAMVTCFGMCGISEMFADWLSQIQPESIPGYYLLANIIGTFGTGIIGLNTVQGVFLPIFMQWGAELGLGAAQSFLSVWLPTSIGGFLLPTLVPSILFAWTFKYKGEAMFTFKDGIKVAGVVFVAWYIAAAICQFGYWWMVA